MKSLHYHFESPGGHFGPLSVFISPFTPAFSALAGKCKRALLNRPKARREKTAWEAGFGSRVHNGDIEPQTRLSFSPCALISLRFRQICCCNSCCSGLHARSTHSSGRLNGIPQQRGSIHQRLNTPADARQYAKLSRPHVSPSRANNAATTPSCVDVFTHTRTRSFGCLGCLSVWDMNLHLCVRKCAPMD